MEEGENKTGKSIALGYFHYKMVQLIYTIKVPNIYNDTSQNIKSLYMNIKSNKSQFNFSIFERLKTIIAIVLIFISLKPFTQ